MNINLYTENGCTYAITPTSGSVTLTPVDKNGTALGTGKAFGSQDTFIAMSDYYNASSSNYTITLVSERGAGVTGGEAAEVDLSNINQNVTIHGELTALGLIRTSTINADNLITVREVNAQSLIARDILIVGDTVVRGNSGALYCDIINLTSTITADTVVANLIDLKNGAKITGNDGMVNCANLKVASEITADNLKSATIKASRISTDKLVFNNSDSIIITGVDSEYNSTSDNPQSGKAVKQAVDGIFTDEQKTYLNRLFNNTAAPNSTGTLQTGDDVKHYVDSHTTQKFNLHEIPVFEYIDEDTGTTVISTIAITCYHQLNYWYVEGPGMPAMYQIKDNRDFPDIQLLFYTGDVVPTVVWNTSDTGDIHWLDGTTPQLYPNTQYILNISVINGEYLGDLKAFPLS